MEDLTQKSSMSPTQENSESVYDQFNIQKAIHKEYSSTGTPDGSLATQPNVNSLHSRYASARTESTAITYQEDDPRHLRIDFELETTHEVEELLESQDASYTIPQPEIARHFYEPQTPAPAVNPFLRKGSVMKGHELFGATQPSSIGRQLETPGSARPSPDVYNDFSSPPKRRRILSSPLQQVGLQLESSQGPMLRTSGIQSFDIGPRGVVYEPRAYVSMQESQERRNQGDKMPQDSDSDSDCDVPLVPPNRRRETQLRIQNELSSVELRKKTPSSRTSSAPVPVEVPSTRRSLHDEEGTTQRGRFSTSNTPQILETQSQDDVIVDSQTVEDAPPETFHESVALHEAGEINDTLPSLPLQEPASSRQEIGTPTLSNRQSPGLETVPETSPPAEERLRPMGEIASFSFGAGEDDDLLVSMPGFTHDAEFENARRMHYSSPPTRIRSLRKHALAESNEAITTSSRTDILPPLAIEKSQGTPVDQVSTIAQGISSRAGEQTSLSRPAEANLSPDQDASNVTDSGGANSEAAKLAEATFDVQKSKTSDSAQTQRQSLGSAEGNDRLAVSIGNQRNEIDSMVIDLLTGEAGLEVSPTSVSEDISPSRDIELPSTGQDIMGIAPQLRASGSSTNKASRNLRATTTSVISRQSSRVAKKPPKPSRNRVSDKVNTSSTPCSSPLRSMATVATAIPGGKHKVRTSKRKSGVTVLRDEEPVIPTRSSKRQSIARESSEDPLSFTASGIALFSNMAFAVSYVKHDKERERITQLIQENSGQILQEGFDKLFELGKNETELRLSLNSRSLGFTALIADEHSRRAKYMQALALGLPCISGHWISACVAKGRIVEWSPYLLCAGMSSLLETMKSRTLLPYCAASARLEDMVSTRDQLLNGKSVLFVTGKGKAEVEKRRAYTFLTRALGPSRLGYVSDLSEARKELINTEHDHVWDMLYVGVEEKKASQSVFGTNTTTRKRKEPEATQGIPHPTKKIRIIADETMIQSLIMGQLMEDY
jgi:hypothetical protein